MKKTYVGKELKAPYTGDRTERIANPAKKEEVFLTHKEMLRVRTLLKKCTALSQLLDLANRLERCIDDAEENDRRPAEIDKVLWSGCVMQEFVRCGKKGCKCEAAPCHGPYWYHYSSES